MNASNANAETPAPAGRNPATSLLVATRIHWAPGPARSTALLGNLDESGRYPMNSTITDTDVTAKIAASVNARPENIVLGAGSGEILRSTVRAFTSKSRHLVTAAPSYGSPVNTAQRIETEVPCHPRRPRAETSISERWPKRPRARASSSSAIRTTPRQPSTGRTRSSASSTS